MALSKDDIKFVTFMDNDTEYVTIKQVDYRSKMRDGSPELIGAKEFQLDDINVSPRHLMCHCTVVYSDTLSVIGDRLLSSVPICVVETNVHFSKKFVGFHFQPNKCFSIRLLPLCSASQMRTWKEFLQELFPRNLLVQNIFRTVVRRV